MVFPILLLLTAALVELASRGRLRRNRLAGIRTRASMRSDAAWVAAHRAASKTVSAGFAVSVIASSVALMNDGIVSVTCSLGVVAIFLITAVVTLVQANRASRTATPL